MGWGASSGALAACLRLHYIAATAGMVKSSRGGLRVHCGGYKTGTVVVTKAGTVCVRPLANCNQPLAACKHHLGGTELVDGREGVFPTKAFGYNLLKACFGKG